MGLLDIFNHQYPYTDFHELNLDWVIKRVIELDENLKNFINLNTIKYANPILWDITRQYEGNTVVVDGATGNAYISVKAVPSGVQINRSEYWTQIYNYQNALNVLREQIAFNEGDTTTATRSYGVDSLVFVKELLYRVISPMIAGDSFIVGSNIEKVDIELLLKQERSARQQADTKLQNNIDAEASTRLAVDNALGERITKEVSAEATARTNTDTQLQNNINNIIADINANIRPNIDNTHMYIISVGVGCDFTTINDAVSEMRNRIANNQIPVGAKPIIAIHAGFYDESVNLLNCPNITLIGVDGPHSVTIATSQSAYPDSPIHVSGNATIINLSMNGTRSYGMHYEYQNGPTSGDVRFYNCEFVSTVYASAGIGMGPDCSLSFFDCSFVSTESPQAGVFFFHNYPHSATNMEISLYNCRIFDTNTNDYNTIRWDDVNKKAGDSLLSFRVYNTIVSPPTFKFQKVDATYSDSIVGGNNGNLILGVNNNVIGLDSKNYGVINEDVMTGMLAFGDNESYTVIHCDNAFYYNLNIEHIYTSDNRDITSQVTSFNPSNDSTLVLRTSDTSVVGKPVRVVFTKTLK